MKTNYATDYPTEYEQGRRARLTAISRDESPYGVTEDQDGKPMKSKAQDAWLAGYEDAEGEAARNETSGPQGNEPNASDQTATVAAANKAKAGK